MSYPIIKLKPGKEASSHYRHPWIFSGAIANAPPVMGETEGEAKHGDLVRLVDSTGLFLAVGTYSAESSIAVRLLDWKNVEINSAWFADKFLRAQSRRELLGYGPGTSTTGYRVIFGESDEVPGLIVDRFNDVFVIQIATAGLDALRGEIVSALQEVFSPRAVVERSDMAVRSEEKLESAVGVLFGEDPGLVEFTENGLKFVADVLKGQKTGFFCDQKDLRQAVRELSAGRQTLNLFSYSGSAGIAAIAGGATSVLNVDASDSALELCQRQAELNGIADDKWSNQTADIFEWLSPKQEPQFDLVMIDPPALIKSKRDVEQGKKGYHFLNRAALRLVKDGGIFVSSSCSHFLTEDDLAFILRRASVQANVKLQVLKVIHQSPDHPDSVYFPEAKYLKSFICRVQR